MKVIELKGIAVSKGIEIAKAWIYKAIELEIEHRTITNDEIHSALDRWENIQNQAKLDLEELKIHALESIGSEESEIFDAHLMMLEDPMFVSMIVGKVENDKKSLGWAVEETTVELVKMFSAIEDDYLRARAADIEDIGRRLLMLDLGVQNISFDEIREEIILVAKDLKPSETARLTPMIKGILLEDGSQTSHAAIMAKAKGIPTIVAIDDVFTKIEAGALIVLDAINNRVLIEPDEENLNIYIDQQKKWNQKKEQLKRLKDEDAVTLDGKVIKLYGNIGTPDEGKLVVENGGKGVGLFRTEFLYMEATDFPTEEEQFSAYKAAVVQKFDEVVIRTLDIGGDKTLPYFTFEKEENPFLGLRALRFSLSRKHLFKTQLRAILRASAFGKASIMFPMVATVEEVYKAKEILESCKAELREEGVAFDELIKIGIMIEIPAAASIADLLIEEVEFFSLGTNDLCQYTLAVDRMNKEVAYLYQPLHPAILRLIKQTAEAANEAGKEAGVCGEMAGDPLNAVALIGLGITKLSMSPSVIAEVKEKIRSITFEQAKNVAKELLKCKTTQEVVDRLNQEV